MNIEVISFGHKHGAPPAADLVLDARPLPNPFYRKDLRPLTGLDGPVMEWLVHQGQVSETIEIFRLLACNGIYNEQRRSAGVMGYRIAIGCTGGRHRSVYCAERLFEILHVTYGLADETITINHRELTT